mmetsp:Transcript_64323/g.208709  ORF Transcript_64323/g.208709 Transcript_64323/m.208709 type:complete len:242 (+) Transcript_64323:1222-1947(+)
MREPTIRRFPALATHGVPANQRVLLVGPREVRRALHLQLVHQQCELVAATVADLGEGDVVLPGVLLELLNVHPPKVWRCHHHWFSRRILMPDLRLLCPPRPQRLLCRPIRLPPALRLLAPRVVLQPSLRDGAHALDLLLNVLLLGATPCNVFRLDALKILLRAGELLQGAIHSFGFQLQLPDRTLHPHRRRGRLGLRLGLRLGFLARPLRRRGERRGRGRELVVVVRDEEGLTSEALDEKR